MLVSNSELFLLVFHLNNVPVSPTSMQLKKRSEEEFWSSGEARLRNNGVISYRILFRQVPYLKAKQKYFFLAQQR